MTERFQGLSVFQDAHGKPRQRKLATGGRLGVLDLENRAPWSSNSGFVFRGLPASLPCIADSAVFKP